MLKSATCSNCGGRLPLDCGFFQFKFAPRELQCGRCHCRLKTPWAYRSNWMSFQLFRGCLILGALLGFLLAFATPERFVGMAIFGTIFGSMIGMVGGTLLAVIVAPILQFFTDIGNDMKQLDQPREDDTTIPR